MMPPSRSIRLILFSGLACNEEVFIPQKLAFPQLLVPKWPVPLQGETLAAYCKRLAEELQSVGPCVIGGASFGGVVAQEVSQHLQTRAVVLIGSIRAPAELPIWLRWLRPWRFLLPLIPVRLLKVLVAPLTAKRIARIAPRVCGLARQFRACDPRVFRWSLQSLLEWEQASLIDGPVFQIHGERDYVLPARRTHPDRLVAGGGHVISLTHGKEVNAFLREVLDHAECD